MEKLSNELIRGLVIGEGSFTFCTVPVKDREKGIVKKKLPRFALSMSKQDFELVKLVKESLGLKNNIHEYKFKERKDRYNRQTMVMLAVSDFGQIKNIIIPLFYKKLYGNKAKQFEEWIEKIGNDPEVYEKYKFIYKLYKEGFYDKNERTEV